MKRICLFLILFILCSQNIWAARAKVDDLARDPYVSALVIDADTNQILFEDNASALVYPASVLKLMDLLVILEYIEQGKAKLDQMVQVTKEASQMGGSQVYLDPNEQFSVEDLIYALAVQSANDAAVALATHLAGSTKAFIDIMNRRAQELGMKDTHFYSVHGLPPAKGQEPDQTTARDLSILARELAKKPEIFLYTGTTERPIRDGKFIMRNHNHLLGRVNGCDGFKTGYFQAAGFSIVATAQRDGTRIIAIVMGSKDRKIRDAKTTELLAKGFALVPPKPQVAERVGSPEPALEVIKTAVASEPERVHVPEEPKTLVATSNDSWRMFFLGLGLGVVLSALLVIYFTRKRTRKNSGLRSLH